MKVRARIEGLKELKAGLEQFKKSTQAGVLSRALRKAAKPMADEARKLAPKNTHELEKSIGISVVKTNAGKAAYAAAMKAGANRAEAADAARTANQAAAGQGAKATVLVGTPLWRAHFPEFGTHTQPAHPYLTPAFHAHRNGVVKDLGQTLRKEIEATAKRVARRKKGK